MTTSITLLRRLSLVLLLALAATSRASFLRDAMPPTNQFFIAGAQAALETAIRADDRAAIDRALAAGASANATGKFHVTPLMIAVDAQRPSAVDRLLRAGASPNAQADDRNGPVSLAVRSCRAQPDGWNIMRAIFAAGGDPNTRQPDGDPVLMRFILDHDAAGLKLMKSLGADLDIRDRGGDPLITGIAMSQDWDMVWALIELGAAYDYEHGRSRQPLSLALRLKYPSPDSPLYPYKRKVWQLLKDQGLPVEPMSP